jgi:hypothetical protein
MYVTRKIDRFTMSGIRVLLISWVAFRVFAVILITILVKELVSNIPGYHVDLAIFSLTLRSRY